MMTIDQTVGKNIEFLRTTWRLSADDFAARIGLTADELTSIETGKSRAGALLLFRICTAFACRPSVFYRGEGDRVDVAAHLLDSSRL